MTKLFTPAPEDYAFHSSLIFNGIVGLYLLLLVAAEMYRALIGSYPQTTLMLVGGIIGPLFVVIAFFRNITLITKVTSRGRRIYVVLASLVTGLLFGILVFLIFLYPLMVRE